MLHEGNALLARQIKHWREKLKITLTQALELVPDDKLDWAPAKKMITLGNIFLHISECSDWWYCEIMKGDKSLPLTGEPDDPCPPRKAIAGMLNAHWARMEDFFAESPDVLTKVYSHRHEGKTHEWDGNWVFTHLLEHDIHHRSQINQYLRILGIEPPKI
ncbi:MAG: DinB family protein [candidate division Zixibacteria bacterium]|nr:DinB family protein [candidate division Zixibacteria bacterium]